MSVDQLSVFLKNGSKDFSEILYEVRGSYGSQINGAGFFTKIRILGEKAKKNPPNYCFLTISKILIH